jgi:hypothetical protein
MLTFCAVSLFRQLLLVCLKNNCYVVTGQEEELDVGALSCELGPYSWVSRCGEQLEEVLSLFVVLEQL